MSYHGLSDFIKQLDENGELTRISGFFDPVLEIAEVTDRVSKLPGGGKALLFTNNGTRFPLLINALGSEKRMALALGRSELTGIEREITSLFRSVTTPKVTLWDKLSMLPLLRDVAGWMPQRKSGRGVCQEVVMSVPNLGALPVLKCWPADGGRFITLPAVHTVDPETGSPNTGMYRMQLFGKSTTGMHWHLHKTGAAHFEKYKALGRKMPVSVTLGGDPVYIYAATAPMPENMDEYLLAGFLRKKRVALVKCLTNDLYVPEDADFVLEGYVDPEEELVLEGPFGDHTGFYSLTGFYPRFHITCITHRRDAVYPATLVGIPPMEDAWIGKATERIFTSPIRLTMIPELVDMDLPFAGVAHNISLVKIRKSFPGQAVKVMNSLWGAGQMMFNKILVVIDEDPGFPPGTSLHSADGELPAAGRDIHDYRVIVELFRELFNPERSLHFSKGPLDILDHSSQHSGFGSKMGIDLTRPFPEEAVPLQDVVVHPVTRAVVDLAQIPFVSGVRDLMEEFSLPVLVMTVFKDARFSKKVLEEALKDAPGMGSYLAVLLFDHGAPLDDIFSLVWLLGGNLEPVRDISFFPGEGEHKVLLADATIKTSLHDRFRRDWPNVVTMDDATISLVDRKWDLNEMGEMLPSPSLKYKTLVKGGGAVRNSLSAPTGS